MNEFIGKWRNFITEDKTPLRENFEMGDIVTFRGMETGGDKMTVVGKRKMFAVKDNGRDLMAILVELPDGTTSEYDETQLTAAPTITSDPNAATLDDDLNDLVDEFSGQIPPDEYVDDPSNPLGEPRSGNPNLFTLDADDVLDSVLDEELFTPNEMGDQAIEDESNSSAFQEGKGQDLADKYVAKLRSEFKNLSDDELDEFKKTIAKSLDLNESKGLKEGKELDVIETDNRDSKYTILRLSNGDYVEVNVIELYQNLIDNQESVNEDINYDEFDEKPKDFKSLLELGAKATKLMGEDKLIEISDAFEERGDEQSDRIASHLNMAIELIQDGESKSATPHLKKFNKACREALRELGESINEGKDLYHVIVRDTGEIISDADGPFDKSFAKRFAAKKKGWIIKKVDESVNEGHSLEGKDLDLLKSLKNQIDQGVLDSKKKDAFVALLNNLINTNISEGMSKAGVYSQIRDIIDSLNSGMSDGVPLDNETEMLLQQELHRLRKIYKSLKEGLPKGFWDKKMKAKDEGISESYATLVNKIEKSGKSKKASKAIAGAVASYKAKGGGKGPTAKQK